MRYIRPLASLFRADGSTAGVKAANIGELINFGLAVPDGFCILTSAFDDAMKEFDIADFNIDRSTELEARYRRVTESLTVPDEVAIEISAAYSALNSPVAIRSSATLEDTNNATFAGQYDSYLNVVTAEAVLQKICECWTSLWSTRALHYRHERGIHSLGKMAVIVQRMINPTVSGVTLTDDVAGSRPNQISISAAFGLGEGLVSGSINPDVFVIERSSLKILHRFAASKEAEMVPSPQGGVDIVQLPANRSESLCLTDTQAQEVAALGLKIERHMGKAQDIEWATDGSTVHVLQSRPIVEPLVPLESVNWENPIPGARWRRNWRLGEWLADPITPLFSTSLLPILISGREKQGLNHLKWDQPSSFAMPEPWHIIVNGYFYTRQDLPFGGPEQPLDPLDRAKRMSDRRPWLDHWRNSHLPAYIQKLQRHQEFDLTKTSYSEILDHLQDLYMDAGEFWYLLAPIGFGFEEFFFAPVYEHLTPKSRPHLSELFSGYGGKTLEAQIELESIATTASSDPSIATLFQNLPADQVLPALSDIPQGRRLSDLINSYLDSYGCQLYSLDFFFPTLGEQPDITVTNIRNYILSSPSPVKGKVETQVARRKHATQWVLGNATGSDQDRAMLRLLLDWHQTCADVRENATFYFQAGWPLIRKAIKELDRRFREAGVLAETNEIYFLEQEEMTAIALKLENGGEIPGGVQASLDQRRTEWETRRKLAPPDRIPPPVDPIWGTGLFSRVISGPNTDAHGRATLVGQGVSPGRIRGRARVVHSPNEFNRIRQGDILVATATNPAWTPLFPLLSALVTETGGGATHCSLIAREYQLPAVMGTGLATQVIRDGQIITVDGTTGVIELEE